MCLKNIFRFMFQYTIWSVERWFLPSIFVICDQFLWNSKLKNFHPSSQNEFFPDLLGKLVLFTKLKSIRSWMFGRCHQHSVNRNFVENWNLESPIWESTRSMQIFIFSASIFSDFTTMDYQNFKKSTWYSPLARYQWLFMLIVLLEVIHMHNGVNDRSLRPMWR